MVSKTCEYGIRAVLFIATHATARQKYGIRTIAKELDIPVYFLSKILQILTKRKLVSSVKGPNGGFYLNNAQLDRSLLDIVDAIDGLDIFEQCGLGLKKCSNHRPCPVHERFKAHREGIKKLMASKSIGEMRHELETPKAFI